MTKAYNNTTPMSPTGRARLSRVAMFAACALALSATAVFAPQSDAISAPIPGPPEAKPDAQKETLAAEAADRALRPDPRISPGEYFSAQGRIVRIFTDRALPAHVPAAPNRRAVTYLKSRFARAEIDSLIGTVLQRPAEGDKGFAVAYDAATDTIVVKGAVAPAQLPAAAVADGRVVHLYREASVRPATRTVDTSPFRGGARIQSALAGGCSSGFRVKLPAGNLRMMTAGHCGGDIGTIYRNNGFYYGTVWRSAYNGSVGCGAYPCDVVILNGSTFASSIYMGGAAGVATTEGLGTASTIGHQYCTSGATTFQICRHTADHFGFVSYNGRTFYVLAMRPWFVDGSNNIQGGDSGGPMVYLSGGVAHPRGIVTAYIPDPNTGLAVPGSEFYVEDWSRISNAWSNEFVLSAP